MIKSLIHGKYHFILIFYETKLIQLNIKSDLCKFSNGPLETAILTL